MLLGNAPDGSLGGGGSERDFDAGQPSFNQRLRQRERMTMSDREVRDRVYQYQRGSIPPPVSRMIYTPTSGAGDALGGPPVEEA